MEPLPPKILVTPKFQVLSVDAADNAIVVKKQPAVDTPSDFSADPLTNTNYTAVTDDPLSLSLLLRHSSSTLPSTLLLLQRETEKTTTSAENTTDTNFTKAMETSASTAAVQTEGGGSSKSTSNDIAPPSHPRNPTILEVASEVAPAEVSPSESTPSEVTLSEMTPTEATSEVASFVSNEASPQLVHSIYALEAIATTHASSYPVHGTEKFFVLRNDESNSKTTNVSTKATKTLATKKRTVPSFPASLSPAVPTNDHHRKEEEENEWKHDALAVRFQAYGSAIVDSVKSSLSLKPTTAAESVAVSLEITPQTVTDTNATTITTSTTTITPAAVVPKITMTPAPESSESNQLNKTRGGSSASSKTLPLVVESEWESSSPKPTIVESSSSPSSTVQIPDIVSDLKEETGGESVVEVPTAAIPLQQQQTEACFGSDLGSVVQQAEQAGVVAPNSIALSRTTATTDAASTPVVVGAAAPPSVVETTAVQESVRIVVGERMTEGTPKASPPATTPLVAAADKIQSALCVESICSDDPIESAERSETTATDCAAPAPTLAEKTSEAAAGATDRVVVVECEPLLTSSDQVVESETAIKLESETTGKVLTESNGEKAFDFAAVECVSTEGGSLPKDTVESETNIFDMVKSGSDAIDSLAEVVTVANETEAVEIVASSETTSDVSSGQKEPVDVTNISTPTQRITSSTPVVTLENESSKQSKKSPKADDAILIASTMSTDSTSAMSENATEASTSSAQCRPECSDQVVESEKAIEFASETAGNVLTESCSEKAVDSAAAGAAVESAPTEIGISPKDTDENETNVIEVVKSGSDLVDRSAEVVTVVNETEAVEIIVASSETTSDVFRGQKGQVDVTSISTSVESITASTPDAKEEDERSKHSKHSKELNVDDAILIATTISTNVTSATNENGQEASSSYAECLVDCSGQLVESEKAIKFQSETAGNVWTESSSEKAIDSAVAAAAAVGSAATESGSLPKETFESDTNIFEVDKSRSDAVDRPGEDFTVANETEFAQIVASSETTRDVLSGKEEVDAKTTSTSVESITSSTSVATMEDETCKQSKESSNFDDAILIASTMSADATLETNEIATKASSSECLACSVLKSAVPQTTVPLNVSQTEKRAPLTTPILPASSLPFSYADVAKQPALNDSPERATALSQRTNIQNNKNDPDVKKDPAKIATSNEVRSSRFVPSLSAVVHTSPAEKREAATHPKILSAHNNFYDAPHVLLLISNQSLNRKVAVNQQKAIAILNAKGVPFKTVDGADPLKKDRRNGLFDVSGLRGEYPQFFHVDATGIPVFLGNFEYFENANANGTLVKEFGFAEGNFTEDLGLIAHQSTVSPPESSATTKSVLILISNQSLNREVPVHQNKAMGILDGLGLQYETIDGADPLNKDRRNDLFELSGLRGEYPQFFLVEGSATSFWGGWERFENANDGDVIARELGGKVVVANLNMSTFGEHAETQEAAIAQCTGDSSKSASLLVLVSNQSLNRPMTLHQEKARSILAAKGIAYESVDGEAPANKEIRNNLFQVSGLGVKYPQFFVVQNGQIHFFGDWEHFEKSNEDGSLETILGVKQIERMGEAPPVVVKTASSTKGRSIPVEVKFQDSGNVFSPDLTTAAGVISIVGAETESSSTDNSATMGTQSAGTPSDVSTPVKEAGNFDELENIQRDGVRTESKSGTLTAAGCATETEITVYGATSFVAKHALDYFMQASLAIPGERLITLAGRDERKLSALQATLIEKMLNFQIVNPKAKGKCAFDIFVADSTDAAGLKRMAERTKLVVNFAGPFAKYGEHVVAACAQCGTDYIDITGEVTWAGQMRVKYSDTAEQSGARIVSFCGFDSVPSDLAVFAAVEALRKAEGRDVKVDDATCWHVGFGLANGGTVQTVLGIAVDLRNCLFQPVPFLMDDPLVLAHPRVRFDPDCQEMKNRMAKVEWLNQLPSVDSILSSGASAPFFMAAVNAKIVHASAVALEYGPNFTYRERFLPMGIQITKKFGILSLIPAVCFQLALVLFAAVIKTPVLGQLLADWIAPSGSGSPDYICKAGFAEVYSEVTSAPGTGGLVDRANCSLKFEGDPGNYVTAQCVCESALALVMDKEKLPPRSKDGFGTPAELLGNVLLNRLQKTNVRPVKVSTHARMHVVRNETEFFC